MVQRRAGPGMIVQQEVQVESKEKCKRCGGSMCRGFDRARAGKRRWLGVVVRLPLLCVDDAAVHTLPLTAWWVAAI